MTDGPGDRPEAGTVLTASALLLSGAAVCTFGAIAAWLAGGLTAAAIWTALTATVMYTAVDAVMAGRMRDAAWIRRQATSNLIFTTAWTTVAIMIIAWSRWNG